VLDNWDELVAEKAAAQRDDLQAATINSLTTALQVAPQLSDSQEANLVAYISLLPRDLRFGFVKSLLRIPAVALAITQDKYDHVIYEAIRAIGAEVSAG
jgi:hypothetical protein